MTISSFLATESDYGRIGNKLAESIDLIISNLIALKYQYNCGINKSKSAIIAATAATATAITKPRRPKSAATIAAAPGLKPNDAPTDYSKWW